MNDDDPDALARAVSEHLVPEDDNVFMSRFVTNMSRSNVRRGAGKLGLVVASGLAISVAALAAEALLAPLFASIAAPHSLTGLALGVGVFGALIVTTLLVRAE